MKATNVVLFFLLLTLAACSTPPQPAPAGSPSAALTAAPTTPATGAPSITPTLRPTYGPANPPLASAEETLPKAATGSGGEISIGVPAGDAYAPFSVAVDATRNLAYVYHADSAERRPVISVVDLLAGKVTRLIRLILTQPGLDGRLFLTPDGKGLILYEPRDSTVLAIETGSGRVQALLDDAQDAVLSEDGRALYVSYLDSVAAYSLDQLLAGKTEPLWQGGDDAMQLVVNGDRLLGLSYDAGRGTLHLLDAVTGKSLAQQDAPDSAYHIAAGPGGGWAVAVGDPNPRLIRYDANLKRRGETPIVYASGLTYDADESRYLVGGSRYDESGGVSRQVILSVDAANGALLAEQTRAGSGELLTAFARWRADALVALPSGSASYLAILDARSLTAAAQITTGVRTQDLVIDDAAGRLYVADDLGRVHVLKLPSGESVDIWAGHAPLALDTANSRLYVNRASGVVALDAATGEVLASFPQAGHPAPDPQADLVYIANPGVTIYDRSGNKLGTLPSTFPVERGFSPNPYAYAAQVNPVTGHLAVILHNGIPGSNAGSYLSIYPRQSDKAVTPAAPHSFVMDLATDRVGNWYVAYSTTRNQEAVHVLSPDGKPLRTLDHRTGYLALDEAADSLYLLTNGRVTRLAASTLTATGVAEGPPVRARVAHSPTTHTAYVIDGSGPLVTRVPLDVDKLASLDLSYAAATVRADASSYGVSAIARGAQRILISEFDGLYRSTDGKAWQRLLAGLELEYTGVTAVDGGTIFVTGRSASGGEGVWRSRDAGDTWEWLTAGLTDLAPDGPVLARSADEAYFVNRGQGLLRWDAAARKWQLANARVEGQDWSNFRLAPDGTLFRNNSVYLERSTDQGATWTTLATTRRTGDIIGFSSLYTVTQAIFSTAREQDLGITAIQRSMDNGKTWTPSLTSTQIPLDGYPLQMASGFGQTYLLTQPYRDGGQPTLLRTTDYGDTWQVAPPDTAIDVSYLAVDPLDGRLWLQMRSSLRSVDPNQLRWTNVAERRAPATATPTRPPTVTPTPTVTAGPCTQTLTGPAAELNARNLGIGCPRGSARTVQMARQGFQNGQMIWRADNTQIYVLYNDGRWAGYEDAWLETDPASDPAIIAPGGLQQPVRGFGKVWREQLGGPKAALGWAQEKEVGVQGQVEDWDYGVVLRFGGETFVLLDRGEWK